MRKLLFVLLVLIVGVIAVGYYRGWISSSLTGDSETGRQGVQFELDRNKVNRDIDKAKQKIGGAGSQTEDTSQGR